MLVLAKTMPTFYCMEPVDVICFGKRAFTDLLKESHNDSERILDYLSGPQIQ